MTPQDLRDLVDELKAKSEASLDAHMEAEARLAPAQIALAALDKTGYCIYAGEAIWIPPPAKTIGLVEFDNDVPQHLAKRAVEVGLRNFFQAPREEA